MVLLKVHQLSLVPLKSLAVYLQLTQTESLAEAADHDV